jgi:hypothetical protein
VHRPVVLTPDPTQPQATRVTEASRVEWADSRVALEVRARDRECLVRAWEVREVPCSREVECKEVEWVLVDLRSVYSFELHCLVDSQPFEQAVLS